MTTLNDDKANALMDQLLEKMQDRISQMVTDKMKPLLENHERLQDQFKDAGRDNDALQKLAKQVHELAGSPKDKPEAVYITRDETRNAQAYQTKKEQSDELGVPLIRVNATGDTSGDTVYTPE